MKRLISLVMPGGLLILASVLLVETGLLADQWPPASGLLISIVFGAGILLAWGFNRSRAVFILLAIVLAERSLAVFGLRSDVSPLTARIAGHAVAVLLPLNVICFSMARERGLVTLNGLWRFNAILLQPVAIALCCAARAEWAARFLEYKVVRLPFLTDLAVPQFSAIGVVVAIGALLLRFGSRRDSIDVGLAWALIAAFVGIVDYYAARPFYSVYFATAGGCLVIALLQGSHSMAFRDELTGLPGRRALGEALDRLSGSYAIAMLDVDHFKRFNDRHGHDVGDEVLRMVASRIGHVSGGGKGYRYGGEEFAVLFSGKTAKEVKPHIEELREEIAEADFTVRGRRRPRKKPERPRPVTAPRKKLKVTVSAGIAARTAKEESAGRVVKNADRALYRAKKAGRNCVRT